MKEKKRWHPTAARDDHDRAPPVTDRAQAAAIAMTQANSAMKHADGAMKQAEAALAAAGLRGEADYGPAAAAMRDTERLERKATERAQTEVEHAMARASRMEHRAEQAGRDASRAEHRATQAEEEAE